MRVLPSEYPLTPPPPLRPREDALFLDLDGTLLEIAERPESVAASAELSALLRRLARAMDGALALITGRTITDADTILGSAVADVAGVHGFHLRRAGAEVEQADADLSRHAAARADAYALASQLGLMIEDKGASYALHYRQSPQRESQVRAGAGEIAALHGLRVLEGRMVVELVAADSNKGDALAAFMRRPPFQGRRPVALGDDITDEDAFERAAVAGGYGILVGDPRMTAAAHRLDAPADVFAWLAASLKLTEQR